MRPGHVRGRHIARYVDTVKDLKRGGNLGELESLLLEIVDAAEAEARSSRWGVAPWCYEELAKLYRKLKDPEREVQILERFAAQRHAPGASPPRLLARLEKARVLVTRKG